MSETTPEPRNARGNARGEETKVLLTGFLPYGGRSINPASAVVDALDGQALAGARIIGRKIPVEIARAPEIMAQALEETDPEVVIALGLWPGERMIRLEQLGVNLADFSVPDNGGQIVQASAIEPDGPAARRSTLPLGEIQRLILASGIPARLSASAGSYLCNALLFVTLGLAASRSKRPLTGFIHLPFLPEQAAQQISSFLVEGDGRGQGDLPARADVASMSLGEMVSAVCIALSASIEARRNG